MNDFVVTMMLLGAVSTGGNMPFWATANQFGLMPEYSGGLVLAGAHTEFDQSKDWKWCWGVSLAGRGEQGAGFRFIPDEAYLSGGWRNISLDLGIRHEKQEFYGASPLLGSLSTIAGRLAWSGNSRSMPGYTLRLAPANIPFTKGHVQIFGSWGDYINIDPSTYVRHHAVHSMRAGLIANIGRFSMALGLDHWAQWAGVHPKYGKMPLSFMDYLRVISGSKGGSESSESDQINVIGNQLGAEFLHLKWRGNGWTVEARHEIPYDDRSGMRFENFPDGVNTLSFSFEDKTRWVSDVVYEFHYTMLQSGNPREKPNTGGDNYCNNGEYRSGWTSWGRCKGNPLFLSKGTKDGTLDVYGLVEGVENNRVKAHHIGLGGSLFRKVPYRLMLTWARNYGTYTRSFGPDGTPLHSVYSSFSAVVPLLKGSLQLLPAIYYDFTGWSGSKFGATLGLSYVFRK